MPIRTPRLLIRPRQPGDGGPCAEAVAETWEQLHQWMEWADEPEHNTAENQEIHTRRLMADFLLRKELALLGIELATGRPVVWCGLHNLDWGARGCDTGYWVRRSAQNRGFATEATHAVLRYAFTALGMHRVGIGHAAGNEPSRRVIEKLGFLPEGVQRGVACLPGGRMGDRHLYARFDIANLPSLEVTWGAQAGFTDPELALHLRTLEEQLLKPEVRSSADTVAALLTAEFREVGASGRLFTKTEILKALATEPPAMLELREFRCDRIAPTVALVTYRSSRRDESNTVVTSRRSSLWIDRNGVWQLYFHQGTRE